MTHVVGIDVSKAKLDVALRRPDGKARSKVVDNTPSGFAALTAWLGTQGVAEVHACMEATGTYWEAVAEFLADAGHTVSVVNPAQIKAFGGAGLVRTKTDRVDARLMRRSVLPSSRRPGSRRPRRCGHCGLWSPGAMPWTPCAPRSATGWG